MVSNHPTLKFITDKEGQVSIKMDLAMKKHKENKPPTEAQMLAIILMHLSKDSNLMHSMAGQVLQNMTNGETH